MQLSSAPAQIIKAWATGDSSKTNPIPVPSQTGITPGAASYTDGFPPLCATPVSSGGIPPAKADMNGILYGMSAVDVWMCAGGGFPYSSTFSSAIGGYPKGARVLMASGGGYWESTVDNNVTDPDTGGEGWGANAANAITALTGDATATGPGSAALTLVASGVTAGSYAGATITVDAKGRVTAATATTHGTNSTGRWEIGASGKITQWGSLSSVSYSVPVAVTFPIAFTDVTSVVVVASSRITGVEVSSYAETINGFTAAISGGSTLDAKWIAVGY